MANIVEAKKTKPYSTKTYTTGDPIFSMREFNKRIMGNDNNNPSTEEAKAQKAAEKAAKDIGTIAAPSPDGASSISLDAGMGSGGGEAAGGGDCGGGMMEDLQLKEEDMYVAKHDATFTLPDDIHIIDKNIIEAELEKLEPEEEFEVGYITPVYFYKELWDKFTLLKCTQLVGYTGIDYIEARADDDVNRDRRLQIAKDTTALGTTNGIHYNRQPGVNKQGDFSANYASTNKTVLQEHGNTLLFYPKVGSRPHVKYYIDLHDGKGYYPIRRDQLERTILQYVQSKVNELTTGVKKDGTPRIRKWDDADLAAKIQKQLESDAATINAVALNQEDKLETRSKISTGNSILKPQVRALYTGQIYYLKTAYATLGKEFNESLVEAKRYVRRYYMKPQNIFCSNKTDVLNALIDNEDQDCTIYTLNNLGDEKDVTKLTSNDVIYYYEDGILYDKNRVRIMDYDLFIKHEENRPKIDVNHTSDSTLSKVYHDRLTGMEDDDMDEAFNLNFDDINAYGEKLTEGKEQSFTCCICGEEINGYGNNPEPYKKSGKCCDACNLKFVIPARIEQMNAEEN